MDTPAIALLAAHALTTPASVVQIHRHRLAGTGFSQPAHAHDDLIQFDLFCACAGALSVDGRSTEVGDFTAAIYDAGTVHTSRLRPISGEAAVYTLKLRPPAPLSITGGAPAVAVQRLATRCTALCDALDRLYRTSLAPRRRGLLMGALAAEVLALWPQDGRRDPGAEAMSSPEAGDGLAAALDLIENSFARRIDVDDLARAAGISRRQLERRFKSAMGMGPLDYLDHRRLTVAKENLVQGNHPVGEVARGLGFSSLHHFSRWFARHAGMPPSSFRRTRSATDHPRHRPGT
ncbi:MAG: helix-turn-helix transcriptional regulator [Planctomycetes bacterium]|nr:helix-turn-helix transcriptional regulator [Planctomycetota bacterium]